ncbi:MAG: ribosome biogenesis factor YjgA [Thiolinea sp.]
MIDDDEEEFVYAERPNRTLLKQETEAYKALVLRMMGMSETLFKALDISDDLRNAVTDAKRFKVGARKRQIRYTTGLMRHEDCDAISAQIDRLERPSRRKVEEFHQLEAWRDQLLAGDGAVIDTLIAEFDALDVQYLRQLVRNAAKEAKNNKPPKSARLLFQYLKELQSAAA